MATLTEYFETEAREFLGQLEAGLARVPKPDAAELHRAARGLRGTAQIAREHRVFRTVGAFEAVARALAMNALAWSDDIGARARATVADLRTLITREEEDTQLEARADAAVSRWQDLGVEMPMHLAGPGAAPGSDADIREFREFAGREVAGVVEALDKGVQQLAAAPMDREPLKAILRRQRALLGAARLDEIPVVAEILRAIEDLTRIIVKLDVGVKQEWLDVYRVAREGLKATVDPLQRNENPPHTHAVSRLRHMREELLERYGAGDMTAPPHGGAAPASLEIETAAALRSTRDAAQEPEDRSGDLIGAAASAVQRAVGAATTAVSAGVAAAANAVHSVAQNVASPAAAPVTTAPDAVPIENLVYNRDAALQRALELREILMRAAQNDPHLRDAVDELFDLIRLAQS